MALAVPLSRMERFSPVWLSFGVGRKAMTIDEFRSASQVASRKLSFALIPILILWFGIFMAIVVSYKSESVSVHSFILGFVAASTLLLPFWFVSRALARRHGLICPHCSYWFGTPEVSSVLRTGRCPKCKQDLFSAQQSDGANAALGAPRSSS